MVLRRPWYLVLVAHLSEVCMYKAAPALLFLLYAKLTDI